MELNWLQSLIYGAVTGITEILPVSAQAHRLLLRKIFGAGSDSGFTLLLIHLGILAAVFMCCQNQLLRIHRAQKLHRLPKKRRKRPLDVVSLLDYSLLKTMAIPVIIASLFMRKVVIMEDKMVIVAALLIVNGILLYIPQFFPGGNKDARMLSRIEGLLIGLGCAASCLPGISGIGAAFSIAGICGVERKYAFNVSLILELLLLIALIIMDILGLAAEGLRGISLLFVIQSLLAALVAFGVTILTVRILRKLAVEYGFTSFSYYCWGIALFSLMLTMFA